MTNNDPIQEGASGWWDENVSVNKPTTRYYYDGQMAVEEDFENGTQADAYVMRYGLGARGIDYMQRVKNNVTTTGFPLYDGHGNMVATLARSGSNSWSLGDKRYFDAWGDVEQGSGAGQPSQRYCANLGHVQDDESDLIYMRARYYEPGVGRFLSQDIARDGLNYYVYCNNTPTVYVDESGNSASPVYVMVQALLFAGGMIIGQSLGYTIATLFFMQLNPAYVVKDLAAKALFNFGVGMLSVLAGLSVGSASGEFAFFNQGIASVAKSVLKSMEQVGKSPFLKSFALGLFIGCIFGILSASYEAFLWRLDNEA